jgi:hypothetical protein
MDTLHKNQISRVVLILGGVTLACRPIMTIGWQEILILIVILGVLVGPALFRLYNRWDEFQRWRSGDGEKKD